MDLNKFGKRCFICAEKRGKLLCKDGIPDKSQTVSSLQEEMSEVAFAHDSEPSDHIAGFSELAEELADVAIVCFTELYRRGIDIEKILHEKASFNERRL